ncbi:MAG TPA: alpha/beta fold hydrolase [Solirubrobacteraceae bacterium]|nr:alpha/beta fold hydrolase [Solirubrobacteraceae bacterium]
MSERDVTAADGRRLRITEEGDPNGTPILWLHGTPGSRLVDSISGAHARERGIRLIGYDRPGCGYSDRQDGRNVADCAADVRAIAAALGIERLAVWGISGGGPHAAACAALLEGLVPAVAVLGSIAPYGAPGLDYFTGMGEANVEDIQLQLKEPDASHARFAEQRRELLDGDLDAIMEGWRSLISPVDVAALTAEFGASLLAQIKEGLRPSVEGWWDDCVAHLSDWGFGLTQIRTPVLVVHGRHDRFVPFSHGEWLAQSIPTAEPMLLEDEGHISLITNRLDEIEDWLLARMT